MDFGRRLGSTEVADLICRKKLGTNQLLSFSFFYLMKFELYFKFMRRSHEPSSSILYIIYLYKNKIPKNFLSNIRGGSCVIVFVICCPIKWNTQFRKKKQHFEGFDPFSFFFINFSKYVLKKTTYRHREK